jgi:hypothetical protein
LNSSGTGKKTIDNGCYVGVTTTGNKDGVGNRYCMVALGIYDKMGVEIKKLAERKIKTYYPLHFALQIDNFNKVYFSGKCVTII